MNYPRFLTRMVKPRSAFYNAAALVAVLALTTGCGGPTPPPPGAGGDTSPADVELGNASTSPPQETGEPTPNSPTGEKPPADDPGAKQ
jgi:hypothetical protein